MPNVLFDARWVQPGMTGVGVVAFQILKAIPSELRAEIGVILSENCPHVEEFKGFRLFFTRVSLTSHPLTEFYEQIAIPYLCYRHHYRRFVSFENRTPAWHFGIETFAYIHDATFLKYWKHNGIKYSLFLFMHLLLARFFATRVVTVSEAAKIELARWGRIPPKKIRVIHNSDSGLNNATAINPGIESARPYLLAVGMSNPRKNLVKLLDALTLLSIKMAPPLLIVTGNRKALEEILRSRGDNPGVMNAGFVPDAQLHYLYENAAGFIYPSLDEGFGIPLLDAALSGCPLACSDIPAFREVAGDIAEYFDPEDAVSIASAISRMLASPRCADPVRLRRRFSWERSALKLLDVPTQNR